MIDARCIATMRKNVMTGASEFELLLLEHYELSDRLTKLIELESKDPFIIEQLCAMRGYYSALTNRISNELAKEALSGTSKSI